MKYKFLISGFVLIVSVLLTACNQKRIEQKKTNQPNFVIIFCDDLDSDELNCYENDAPKKQLL